MAVLQQAGGVEKMLDAVLHLSADEEKPPLSAAARKLLRDLGEIGLINRIAAVRRSAGRGTRHGTSTASFIFDENDAIFG